MSMIEHTATSTLGKIFIGRRILEVMQEKGNAYSIRALADRLGINRETFRITLTGDRPISLSLIEKIAEGLHVTEERLRQLDKVMLMRATRRGAVHTITLVEHIFSCSNMKMPMTLGKRL